MKLTTLLLGVLTAAQLSLAGCARLDSPRQVSEAISIAGLFPTGVDDTGTVLAAGATDPHYALSFSNDSNFPAPGPAIVCTPDGAWVADDATAKWISIQESNAGADNAIYTYSTTFTLSGVDPTTATLTGSWAADDSVKLFINGSTTPAASSAATAYASLASFTVASPGFVTGTNTLSFQTVNSGNGPTGLRLETIAVTAYCTADSQCPNGWCDEQVTPSTNTCSPLLANGQPIPSDLLHNPPLLGFCAPTTVGAIVCVSGVCDPTNNECGLADGTSGCTPTDNPVKCQSGLCSFDGTCIASGTCDVDADCASGFYCDTVAHTCDAQAPTGSPIPGGGTCAVGASDRCLSGSCSTDNVCGHPNGEGPCTIVTEGGTSGDCRSGVCDPNGNAGAGLCEECTQTQTGNCTTPNSICDSVSETCVACNGDDGTVVTAPCGAAEPYCPGSGAACTTCGTPGDLVACSAPGATHAGLVCQPSGACGSDCLVDLDCAMTQYCPSDGATPETCAPDVPNGDMIPTIPGHVPTLDGTCPLGGMLSVCASGVCDTDNLCGYADGDGSCNPGNAMTVCRSGACSTDGACRPAMGCNVDGDCTGGAICGTGKLCQDPPPVITVPANGATLPPGTTSVSGTGIPGQVIVVSVDGTQVGTVTVDGSGNWTLGSVTLTPGMHTISAVQQPPGSATTPAASSAASVQVTVEGAADMSGTDLAGADLAGNDMRGADLAGADLSGGGGSGFSRPSIAGGGFTCEMGGGHAPGPSPLAIFLFGCALLLLGLRRLRRRLGVVALVACVLLPAVARADDQGFSIGRYEPTAAGEWSFAVDHPWYSSTRWFAAGFTLDYAHNPLVAGVRNASGSFTETDAVIAHALLGHFDLAASFLDRVTVSFSLPVTMYEGGNSFEGVSPQSGQVGDPRIGVMVRLFGQPDRSPFSLSIGGWIWVPLGQHSATDGDDWVRVLPKLVAAGYGHHVRYSATFGFLYRAPAVIGNLAPGSGNTVGSEVQFGGLIQYADQKNRWAIGPEATLDTVVNDGHAFHKSWTALELLLGVHYNVIRQLQLGIAGGVGLLREPGTPDFRALFRIAYAPIREKKAPPPYVPPPPPPDRDHDGVIDSEDLCPDVPMGARPDPNRRGCPMGDRDKDGVLDGDDLCPDVHEGLHPDPKRPGCPAADTDGDGIYDPDDECPTVPMGDVPDPKHLGCPLPDRDGDRVRDDEDACPDQPGAPSPDPKKNGCPGLVQIKNGMVVIMQPVFFATNKDAILPKSFPVLQAVADALAAQPTIAHLAIEGHTDNRGKPEHNLDLSERRAQSVMKFLVDHGVAADRLEAHGYGQTRPISSNRTAAGRAANRRVEFHIIDNKSAAPDGAPAPDGTAAPTPAPAPAPTPTP